MISYFKTYSRPADEAERETKNPRTISSTLRPRGFEIDSDTIVTLVENGLPSGFSDWERAGVNVRLGKCNCGTKSDEFSGKSGADDGSYQRCRRALGSLP